MVRMNLELDHLDTVGIGITTLTLLGSIALWNRLPSEIAIHFSATGEAGLYVPKTFGIILVPIVMLLTVIILQTVTRADPPDDYRTYAVALVSTLLLLAAVQFLVLGWNLGFYVPFTAVLGGAIVWCGALITYSYWRTGSILNT